MGPRPTDSAPNAGDVALGLTVTGARAGLAVGRLALLPARLAARAPVLGGPVRRALGDLAAEGRVSRLRLETVAAAELERVIAAALNDERTERIVARALESAGLERIVARALESAGLERLVERVLDSPEMDRVVEYIATSPQVLEAVSHHTQTLAEEMVSDVRRRSQSVDDLAERTVRGWLRRPRPQPS